MCAKRFQIWLCDPVFCKAMGDPSFFSSSQNCRCGWDGSYSSALSYSDVTKALGSFTGGIKMPAKNSFSKILSIKFVNQRQEDCFFLGLVSFRACSCSQETHSCVPALPLTRCVSLGRAPLLSESWFITRESEVHNTCPLDTALLDGSQVLCKLWSSVQT